MGSNRRNPQERYLIRCEWIFALFFDQVVKRNQHADGNEAVGDIEGRPVIMRPVKVEKIDDLAVENPVD